ncbi:MAG: hypothetical protein J5J06_14900 [Phycisphaerae bacterium]|nr:hypothetical protein [Phycisphaerae bacterium]
MNAIRSRPTLLVAASVLLAGILGCPGVVPPPEAVLEGTWELIPSDDVDSRLTGSFLAFDSNGDLARVTLTFDDETTVRLNYPPASTSLDGDQVHISITFVGNSLTFDGTLDSETEPTMATGEVTRRLILGDVTISETQGEATLIRQQAEE